MKPVGKVDQVAEFVTHFIENQESFEVDCQNWWNIEKVSGFQGKFSEATTCSADANFGDIFQISLIELKS